MGVVIVFFLACFLILKHAEVAKDIVELSTTTIMGIMALAITLITGQSAFDWKAVSALSHISEDEKIDSNEEAPDVVVNQRCHKAKYYDDGPFSQ